MTGHYDERSIRIGLPSGRLASSLVFGCLVMMTVPCAMAQFLGAPPNEAATQAPPAMKAEPTEAFGNSALLPGDVIEVQLYGAPQFDYKARIDDDGTISLPFVDVISVGGQSVAAAEKIIGEKLVNARIIKTPQVQLRVIETPNHQVTVSGEIKSPGPIQIFGDKRLLDVISAAGGFTPASSPLITIYRKGSESPIQIELPTDPAAIGAKNILLHAGDSVVIGKLGVVYVLGAFHQQGAVPLRNNSRLTLIQAMSLAGGVNFEASVKKAFILRSGPGGQVEIAFDVNDVVRHRVPDQVLQNEDIVLIPSSNMKAALKGGAAGVAASLLAGIGYITVK